MLRRDFLDDRTQYDDSFDLPGLQQQFVYSKMVRITSVT